MASYPVFTVTDLSGFTGRPVASYPDPYTASAIAQATFLFRIASGLTDWPDDADAAQLAKYGVLQLADVFVLSQPFQEAMASPFTSETIGSYTYTKAMRQLQAGQPLGIMWFDLAIQRLGISDDIAQVTSGSLSLFERDLPVVWTPEGIQKLLGPADINPLDTPFSISRPIAYDPNSGRSSSRQRG